MGLRNNSSEEEGDVDSDSSSASAAKGTKRRRTRNSVGVLTQKLTPIREYENGAGPSAVRDMEMDTIDPGMTEREKAKVARRALLMAPPKEELKNMIFVPNLRKPSEKKGSDEVQVVRASGGPDGVEPQPSKKSMKGRIKIHQLEAERITRALKEKNLQVNMRLARDRSTMMSCDAEQRLDVIKVLKDNGQQGHSYMTKEDRYEVRML